MLGPWGILEDAAYQVGTLKWLGYAAALLVLTWGLLPGLFYLSIRFAHLLAPPIHKPRQTFSVFAASLLPLGLTAWVAFSLLFVFASLSYLWPVISDPFGWGWNLLGTAGAAWQPYGGAALPALQVLVLLVGLLWTGNTARRTADHLGNSRSARPVIAFSGIITNLMMGLLIA